MVDDERDDEERLTKALDAADKMLTDVGGIALAAHAQGREVWELSDEFRRRLWAHLGIAAVALANLYGDTPRSIVEEAYKFVPSDERWRADFERRLADLRRRLDGQDD